MLYIFGASAQDVRAVARQLHIQEYRAVHDPRETYRMNDCAVIVTNEAYRHPAYAMIKPAITMRTRAGKGVKEMTPTEWGDANRQIALYVRSGPPEDAHEEREEYMPEGQDTPAPGTGQWILVWWGKRGEDE